jgi:hypothetical protein
MTATCKAAPNRTMSGGTGTGENLVILGEERKGVMSRQEAGYFIRY